MSEDLHLDIYKDRSELHQDETVKIFQEGVQTLVTATRYNNISSQLEYGYLDIIIENLTASDYEDFDERNRSLIKELVDGITSEVGRAIVGLAVLQLTIKSISPEQSIRLHKGGNSASRFSWKDGISMRTLDRNYNTPFLRKYGLLNINRDGVFMTRSLAENYPYSKLYKAEMRGPFKQWIEIVDALESGSMPPKSGLCYLIMLLKNRSDNFKERANIAIELAKSKGDISLIEAKELLTRFFNETDYSARAFEVVIHAFMQAMVECSFINIDLVPMSQMRSANKKHGNIGDIELSDGHCITESWDAKYGKPYLRDELEELKDKISHHPDVEIAGFVVDSNIDRRKDIMDRVQEISDLFDTEIKLLTFDEWLQFQTKSLNECEKNLLGSKWFIAVVESFSQKRLDIAPIDEPCDRWIEDLIEILS